MNKYFKYLFKSFLFLQKPENAQLISLLGEGQSLGIVSQASTLLRIGAKLSQSYYCNWLKSQVVDMQTCDIRIFNIFLSLLKKKYKYFDLAGPSDHSHIGSVEFGNSEFLFFMESDHFGGSVDYGFTCSPEKFSCILRELLLETYGHSLSFSPKGHLISLKYHFVPTTIPDKIEKEILDALEKGRGRSFLFWGRPGTGKSNLIKNIAMRSWPRSGILDFTGQSPGQIWNHWHFLQSLRLPFVVLDDLDHAYFHGSQFFKILEQFLAQGCIVLASANIPHKLPEALTRPGRFDRLVEVNSLPQEMIFSLTHGNNSLYELLKDKTAAEISEFLHRVSLHGFEETQKEMDEIFSRPGSEENSSWSENPEEPEFLEGL